MRRLALGLGLILAAAAPGARAETLQDAIALAYQSNPTLLAARSDLRAIDERYVQARAGLGPTVEVSATAGPTSAQVTQANILGRETTTTDHADNRTARISLNQPVYNGGGLAAQVSAAHAEVLAGRETLRRTEATLLTDVINAYLDVLLDRQLLQIVVQDTQILQDQATEVDTKVGVRELTVTDQAQARSRVLGAQVRTASARAVLASAEARYLSLVGQSPGELATPPDLPGVPDTLDQALDAADRANPAYLHARYTELASRARIREAAAAESVRVSLSVGLATGPVADYIRGSRLDTFTATVNVSKPLFTSGLDTSRVREARETNSGDSLRVTDSHRQARLSVAQAWASVVASRGLLTALGEQLNQTRAAFEGSALEQRIGARTEIDVLNAEQEYQNTKEALAQRYHDEYAGRVALLSAMGVLQTELLWPSGAPFRPESHLDSIVRRQPLPWAGVVQVIDSLGQQSLRLDPEPRDPVGVARARDAQTMPPAPSWKTLEPLIATVPKPG